MVVILFGIFTEVNDVQYPNAQVLSIVTLSGIVTETSELQV